MHQKVLNCVLLLKKSIMITETAIKRMNIITIKDPHIWLDPTLAMKQAEKIKNALVALQPDHKQEFEKKKLSQHFKQNLLI